ncbi:Oidioi.mRNA.OKI2018_I69.chr2.g5258.t1.cds [Oikopleura dioica]|uniref:Oidioi.mRNA.OKI2018_I69.chr2.g5258.t1.cds n=1 Tax=Oikopleura dioica TaxID=34765 RepID=A0ABN7SZX8_OIKDI|nr:Oidioi.mRNA.OKI2018_I69.chr2.g5258.t1.cds [Oikopleura dioica]
MPKTNFYKLVVEQEMDDPSKDWFFYIKTQEFKSIPGVFWEYSCGCCIKLPSDCSDTFLRGPTAWSFDVEKISKKSSFWGEDDSPPTSHVYCPKEPEFLRTLQWHLNILVRNPRLFPHRLVHLASTALGREKLTKAFTTPAQIPDDINKSLLPENLRKSFEEEKKSGEALGDKELEDLFAAPTNKKTKKQKKSAKKPNKGKTPNNIRKTKKPVRLNETSTETEARPLPTGNTYSSKHPLQFWNLTSYENFPAIFNKIDKNGLKKHYIANLTISLVNLNYDEAEKFCATRGLKLASDELEIKTNSLLYGTFGWINSKVNFSSGKLQIANIYKARALEKIENFNSRKIFAQREFTLVGIPVCVFIDENLHETRTGNTLICENDPFDENGRVKVFRNCTMNCKSLQLNATFINKHGLFVRSEEIWHEEKGENKTFVYVVYCNINATFNARLYQRLLNGYKYVLDTNQTGCKMPLEEAIPIFDKNPWDSNQVPDECVKLTYRTGFDASS